MLGKDPQWDTGGLSRCVAPSWPCAGPIMATRPCTWAPSVTPG